MSSKNLPHLDELIEIWTKKAANNFTLREQTFSTRTCNLGGAHSERFENRLENIKRTSNTTIPHYNPMSDPHLVNYRKHIMTALPPGLASSTGGRSKKVSSLRQKVKKERDDSDLEGCVVNPPLGTDHVLELKKLFFKNSTEFTGICCRSEHCAVSHAGVSFERVRIIHSKSMNLHELICKGISVTNGFCSLHERLPVPYPSMPLLFDWLVLLNGLETLDWPSFLLLCTANLSDEWAAVAQLRNSYDCFIQTKPTVSEESFHELIAFLYFNLQAGKVETPGQEKLSSFFQSGDFYRARHICNFAEVIFALQPRRIQFYLYKANGRGQRLGVNYCGHTSVTEPGGDGKDEDPVERAKKRAASARAKPRPSTGSSICPRKQIIGKQAEQLRFHRRVWA